MDWIGSSAITAIPVATVGAPAIYLAMKRRGGAWIEAGLLTVCLASLGGAAAIAAFREEYSIPALAMNAAWLTGVVFFVLYTLSRIIGERHETADEEKRQRDNSSAASDALKRGDVD